MIQFLSKNYNKKYWEEMVQILEYSLTYSIQAQMSRHTKVDLAKAYDYALSKLDEGEQKNAGRI